MRFELITCDGLHLLHTAARMEAGLGYSWLRVCEDSVCDVQASGWTAKRHSSSVVPARGCLPWRGAGDFGGGLTLGVDFGGGLHAAPYMYNFLKLYGSKFLWRLTIVSTLRTGKPTIFP